MCANTIAVALSYFRIATKNVSTLTSSRSREFSISRAAGSVRRDCDNLRLPQSLFFKYDRGRNHDGRLWPMDSFNYVIARSLFSLVN